jgi:hypothetical protein
MKIKNFINIKGKEKLLIIYIVVVFIILAFLTNIVSNVNKDVPVIKADAILLEKDNIVEIENITLVIGNVSYLNRPKKTQADTFPAVAARVTLLRGNKSIIGPWETVSYNGSGRYSFNIGFNEMYYPKINDRIHVSIMIVDKKGERIGYFVKDMIWN